MRPSTPQARAHVWISGEVQGVGFRFSAQRQARRLGVTGWVRNCADGRVELVVEAEEPAVEQMLEWCRSGPSGAWVQHMEERRERFQGEFQDFSIAPTG